jgi:hypothetical protein
MSQHQAQGAPDEGSRIVFDDRVFDYVTGGLPEEERAMFESEMDRSPVLAAMCREAEELMALVAEGMPGAEPSAELRGRVLADVEPRGWLGLIDTVARVWDLGVDQVRAVFQRAMDAGEWEDALVDGVQAFHLDGGPSTVGADVGIIRFEPGMHFPEHSHGELEYYVVLAGELHDADGTVETAGYVATRHAGSHHHYTVGDKEPAYIALVLRGGLTFEDGTGIAPRS